jgi:hypothetical protein
VIICTPHPIIFSYVKIKDNELGGACGTEGGKGGSKRNEYGNLVGKAEGKIWYNTFC